MRDHHKLRAFELADQLALVVYHATSPFPQSEKEKAIAAKTRAESDKLEFATIVRKLRLLLEVQRAMEHDRVDDFLDVLKEMPDRLLRMPLVLVNFSEIRPAINAASANEVAFSK